MGSVRRLSLVGRHRRNKSGGSGLTLLNLNEGQQLAPSPPTSSGTSPVLPPVSTSTSQLSLRLPSSSSTSNGYSIMSVGGSRHSSMHVSPSLTHMASVASSQSYGSSMIPALSFRTNKRQWLPEDEELVDRVLDQEHRRMGRAQENNPPLRYPVLTLLVRCQVTRQGARGIGADSNNAIKTTTTSPSFYRASTSSLGDEG